MEEKLEASDGQSGGSEVRLFQRCQELQLTVQEKEEVIAQLAQQLEEQVNNDNCTFIPSEASIEEKHRPDVLLSTLLATNPLLSSSRSL